MPPTPEQTKKLNKLAKLVDGGNLALIEHLFELEQKIDELKAEIPDLDSVLESIRGKDSEVPGPQGEPGEDYILTEQDKAEIASQVTVPVVEKVIEKTVTIRETPIVTENVVEVAVTDTPEKIIEKINSTDAQIEPERIKGLGDLKNEVQSVKTAGQSRAGWGAHPLVIEDSNGAVVDKVARRIKFANSTVARSPDGKVTVTPSSSSGVTTFGIQGDATQLTGAVTVSAGTNILLTRSGQNIRIAAISVSPTSFGEMTATGSRDTTNKDFTFSSQPVFIVANGFTLHYSATANPYSFTWNAGTSTATIPQPVGTSGVIYGMGTISA